MLKVTEVQVKEKRAALIPWGDVGLIVAFVALLPLVLFAALWTVLLIMLIATWVMVKLGWSA